MKYKDSKDYQHAQRNKIGILFVNLGTPEQPEPKALRKYLKEFLSDPRVVAVPRLIWWFILNLIILPFRSKRSAKAYASVWTEEGSPLMVNSKNLVNKVAQKLDQEQFVVDLAMRYGRPSISKTINSLMKQGATKLLIMPLYPQYSATTTASVFDGIAKELMQLRKLPELRFVNHYHDHPLYIKALADSIRESRRESGEAEKLVLSYHGIPKFYWDKGDPYVCECFKTSRLVAEELGLNPEQIMTTFQSRFGKAEWVQPYTDKTLISLAQQGVKSIDIACPGFAVDCLETLEEIEEENKDYFMEAGGDKFTYIPCLNSSEQHADLFVDLVHQHSSGWKVDRDETARQSRFEQFK